MGGFVCIYLYVFKALLCFVFFFFCGGGGGGAVVLDFLIFTEALSHGHGKKVGV